MSWARGVWAKEARGYCGKKKARKKRTNMAKNTHIIRINETCLEAKQIR